MKNSYPNLLCLRCLLCLLIFPTLFVKLPDLFQIPRLDNAYTAFQAWKRAIQSDPMEFTSNRSGPDVRNYSGLGLLTDLALIHLNSNRFSGTIPESFNNLQLLYELDLDNNLFTGFFPSVILSLPSLKFLDLRFNQFEDSVPSALFDLKLDALFINDNKFRSSIPDNMGNSPVYVIVLANNVLDGSIPSSPLSENFGEIKTLEQLHVSHNKLYGNIPASICSLPRLLNFTYSNNYLVETCPLSQVSW
ncbi:hypothetical protein NE237_015331 [Protea cynaroides]|uniref:Uncharacterized protein n=1 Tax=Protea cynaroides TaxID=273540 RepID=A0A9Q0KDV3_9MAGN|nr:hypothetical protein NE237_015331 [Protea cynaroides]